MSALSFHPLANLFPLLDGADFEELVADVRTHGVREPIWVYEGKILDGRNRWLASQAAGVDCPTRVYEGDAPVDFVISLNLKRRHLTTSQRAMIAVRLATMRQGERTDLPSNEGRFLSQEQAAELLNVGLSSVERAKLVCDRDDPALIEAVEAGEISVSNAAERVRRGIVTGVAMTPHAERGLDFYETPPPAVRALLGAEELRGPIWEPACGSGRIVRVLRAAGHRVVATDVADYGCPDALAGVDFLAQTAAPEGARTIVTNPPFMHANAFVRHALTLVPRVVMLLRLAFLEGTGRSDILDGGQLARVLPFRNRLSFSREGSELGGAIAFAWFLWACEHRGPTELHRISWHGDQAPQPEAPTGETWDSMWAKPFDYTKLDGGGGTP